MTRLDTYVGTNDWCRGKTTVILDDQTPWRFTACLNVESVAGCRKDCTLSSNSDLLDPYELALDI